MNNSLQLLFDSIKELLQKLDLCFSSQDKKLLAQKNDLIAQHKMLSDKRLHLLEHANVSINERTILSQGHLASLREKILQENLQLNTKISSIESKICSVTKSQNTKSATLKKLEQVLQKLKDKKKVLEHEIDERGLIESVWKYLFGDPEKNALSNVNSDIQKKYTEQSQLQADCDTLRQELVNAQNDLSVLSQSLEQAKCQLSTQNKRLDDIREAMKLEDNLEQLLLHIKSIEVKIRTIENEANDNKAFSLKKINELCQLVREQQPKLDSIPIENFGKATEYPEMFAFGRLRFSDATGNWHGYLPRLLPFPFMRGLRFDDINTAKEWINIFLLRTFQTMPCKHISISVIDPFQLGQSVAAFQFLLKNKRPFTEQRFLTRSDEIEATLNSYLVYVENLIQQVFIGGINDWKAYNKLNKDNQLDYRILIIFDIPEQITEKSNLFLSRLLEHGPRCGILPLIVCNYTRFDERRNKDLLEAINKFTWKNEDIYAHSSMTSSLKNLHCDEELENKPDTSTTERIVEKLFALFSHISSFSGSLEQLWSDSPLWSGNSTDGLFANIGWTSVGNKTVTFSIGGVTTEHHTLLGGKSGSGKSNLLHVLIHSLCHNYSPQELNLFLLDYKQGTEFNIYAEPYLPNARLVATESDVDYGITVLHFLVDELKKRSSLFKASGSTDYREYRRKNLSSRLPRILLIIDEFQMLFAGDLGASVDAEKALVELLRQGRAYGIHLLLATQTLRGLQNQSIGQLISQMGCRIALSCAEEDSSILLGNSNWAAAQLQSPPEGILNNENGNKSANIKFNIPFAPADERKKHQEAMLSLAMQTSMPLDKKIFNGNTLPVIPSASEFQRISKNGILPLLLGKNLDFLAEDFLMELKKENLLVVGYDATLRAGIMLSIMRSLCALTIDKHILFYQAHDEQQSRYDEMNGEYVITMKDSSWDGGDLISFVEEDKTEKFILIDSLDYARMFQTTTLGAFRKPGQTPTPADTLKSLLENTATNRTHVILFIESYKRFANSAKELLNLFDLRIGFGLDEDDAGGFVSSGGYGKFKGLRVPNKAVCVNRKRNSLVFIRPFVQEL